MLIRGRTTSPIRAGTVTQQGGSALATYTYGLDAMGRSNTMTDQNNNSLVSGVTYNAANKLLT